jgi:hypothetical protein
LAPGFYLLVLVVHPTGKEIEVCISGATFYVTPLDIGQRAELLNYKKTVAGEDVADTIGMAVRTLQMALKRMKGVVLANGEDFPLERGSDGLLSESCAKTLLNASTSLLLFAVKMANGVIDSDIDGVKLNVESPPAKKKKK